MMAKKEEPKVEAPKEPKKHDPFLPTEGKDIDQRMAELLEEHKKMGVR